MTDERLTAIYNEANGITGKRLPITTVRIFTAMRAAIAAERARWERPVFLWPACMPDEVARWISANRPQVVPMDQMQHVERPNSPHDGPGAAASRTVPLNAVVRAQALEHMAAQVARSQDGVIADAITAAIGEEWTLASLTGRLMCKVYPDGVEVVSLDGIDVLELHPVRFEQVTEGGAIKIKAAQDYRVLRPTA